MAFDRVQMRDPSSLWEGEVSTWRGLSMTSVSKCIQSGVCVVERWRGLEEESRPGPKPSHARLCAGQCAHKAPLSTPFLPCPLREMVLGVTLTLTESWGSDRESLSSLIFRTLVCNKALQQVCCENTAESQCRPHTASPRTSP